MAAQTCTGQFHVCASVDLLRSLARYGSPSLVFILRTPFLPPASSSLVSAVACWCDSHSTPRAASWQLGSARATCQSCVVDLRTGLSACRTTDRSCALQIRHANLGIVIWIPSDVACYQTAQWLSFELIGTAVIWSLCGDAVHT